MTGFGDSTQNFELRVYVGEIAYRGNVQNELQFRIVEVCKEHDIELAFPQRDVWIRNAEELRAEKTQPESVAPISDSKRA